MIYPILGLFIFILVLFEIFLKNKKLNKLNYYLVLILLIFFAGLRDNVGTDWEAYYSFYKNKVYDVEYGYAFLNNLFSDLKVNYNIFLIILNLLSVILIFKYIKKNSKYVFIGILYFFSNLYLYYNFSGFRQAIAIALTSYSISFLLSNKKSLFVIFVILASTFHLTAIVFLLILIIPRERIKLKYFILVISSFFLLTSIFLNELIEIVSTYTIKNADAYINIYNKSENIISLFVVGLLVRVSTLLAIYFFGRNFLESKNGYFYTNIYIFGFLIFCFFYLLSPDIGTRLSSYFTIMDLILVGNLLFYNKKNSVRLIILLLFSFISFYKLFGYSVNEFFIYKTIFN